MWFELIGVIAMVVFVFGMIMIALSVTRRQEFDN